MTVAVSVLAACGGDDADGSTSATDAPSATTAPPELVEGCADAATDITDMSAGREPARRDAGAPAPVPLPQREKIVFANAFKSEYVAPFILAERWGSSTRRTSTSRSSTLSMEDALPQMRERRGRRSRTARRAPGCSTPTPAASSAKWVLGNFFPPNAGDHTVPQTGLWARRDAVHRSEQSGPEASSRATSVASAVGLASVISYPIAAGVLSRRGRPDARWSTSRCRRPTWSPRCRTAPSTRPGCSTRSGRRWRTTTTTSWSPPRPPGEPLGGIFFGERLLEARNARSARRSCGR